MLNAFQAPGRFRKGNIHGHSDMSDGLVTPEEACARYRQAGYDFIALTDHFMEKYDFPLTDTRPFRDEAFTTIIGAELHAPETSRGEIWHVLAVGLPLDFAVPAEDETGPELARRARAAGAFVAIAHPHWYQLQKEDGLALDAAHAVEAYNHTSHVRCDRGDGLVMLDTLLSEGRRLFTIAVDDSHWMSNDAFGGWVMVKTEENTPEALLAALHDGAFYSSQGPQIHDIRIEGDELVVATSPAAAVVAVGEVARNHQKHALPDGELLTETRLSLEPFRGAWCRVAVADENGRRAWTNPLWLD
ncbi:CehA/McbA family metallohydrolase [Labrenzia sp. 011]|uniref:PHP domain-containing protein n=1 Tax=Labrenzia sp. 011 TaxID=2171494 RepID=UPI000D507FD1|nr:CehA/McbA family metallohydrolase [Labrenzia sp. 011]PVB59368.1 phosphotransferase [Labrenzia sp. 011]